MKEWNGSPHGPGKAEDTPGLYNGEAQGDGSSPAMLTKNSSVVSCLLLEMEMELWQQFRLETVLENHRASPALQQEQFVNCVTLRSGDKGSRGCLAQNRQTLGGRKPCANLTFYSC